MLHDEDGRHLAHLRDDPLGLRRRPRHVPGDRLLVTPESRPVRGVLVRVARPTFPDTLAPRATAA